MSVEDKHWGLTLAISSSLFIGSSFIIKKKGLKYAGVTGVRAGVGGYSYLYEPLWWAGMITMIVGEIANFTAYAFAPAVLVTPLGVLSIIVSASLAHFFLKERLHSFGIIGCILCIVGSIAIVLHAPEERVINSVKEVWTLATEPVFLIYASAVVAAALLLVFHFVPRCGQSHVMVYIGICSLVGSMSVMSVKALGIALKLTFEGDNQLIYPQSYVFALVVIACVLTQVNYLNKALDTFDAAVVSPIYYAMFTSLTILASAVMFKDWNHQTATQIMTEVCGFVTILSGTFLLHGAKDMTDSSSGTGSMWSAQSSAVADHNNNSSRGTWVTKWPRDVEIEMDRVSVGVGSSKTTSTDGSQDLRIHVSLLTSGSLGYTWVWAAWSTIFIGTSICAASLTVVWPR